LIRCSKKRSRYSLLVRHFAAGEARLGHQDDITSWFGVAAALDHGRGGPARGPCECTS
jgi:hypothetical protein